MSDLSKIITGELKEQLVNKIKDDINRGPAGIVAVGAAVAMALIAESEIEKDSLEYARYELDGAGKIGDNVRLVFLTDLHEKEFGPRNRDLLEMIKKADPDIVLIGGDMPVVSRSHGIDLIAEDIAGDILSDSRSRNEGAVARLEGAVGFGPAQRTEVSLELCRQLVKKYPVFYANGNHEQRMQTREYFDALEKMGVIYLSNRTVEWKYNLSITGINLGREQYQHLVPKAPDEGFMKRRMDPDPDRYNILLAHSPEFIKSYAKAGADLVLAGHYHGGTIRLPGNVGLMTPQYQFFSPNVVGIKHYGTTKMVISSGLGTHSVNIRINDKPQVVVVDIKK